MAAAAVPVVGLAEPPRWLPLGRPEGPVPRTRSPEMEDLGLAPDLSRLPEEIRDLVKRGNRGEYASRSEADWAACVAMFRAGYGVDEVWMVMTDPSHGISEKFVEKGGQGEAYLELTISKAYEFFNNKDKRRGTTYARRKGGVSID